MSDLADFLNARLDEDERELEKDPPRGLGYANLGARIWREIEAKRAIMTEHAIETSREEQRALAEDIAAGKPPTWRVDEYSCVMCGWFAGEHGACETLRHLAAVYIEHPDYRQEWMP